MKLKVRYLVKKPGRHGEPPRYFWQPSEALRRQGYALQRVPEGWATIVDPADLEEQAVAAAQDLNRQLDAQRRAAPATPRRAAAPQLRTIDALIALYRASTDFTTLRPSTQRGYEQCLDRLGAWAGDAPVTAIGAKRVKVLKQSMAHTPAFANAVIRVLRLLLEFARREEWIQINPAAKPQLLGTDPSGLLWPREAVALFTAAADAAGWPSIGTAVVLDEWIGQRQGDVLRLPRNLLQRTADGMVTLRQGKTGVAVSLPIGMVPHLVARVEQERARLDDRFKDAKVQPVRLLICETTGAPWQLDHFRHIFADIRAAVAAQMLAAKRWKRDETTGTWHNLELALMLSQCGLQGPALAARLEQERRRACSLEVDYLIPGRAADAPDAFLLCVEDLWFMHLRHTAITRLAEAEADNKLISLITGHSSATIEQILSRYLVRTKKLARLAFQKRLDAEGLAATPASKQEGGA